MAFRARRKLQAAALNNAIAAEGAAGRAYAEQAAAGVAIGAVASSTTIVGNVITEVFDGISVVSTIAGNVITAVYGVPISQTWVTTITGASVVTERTA